MYIVLFLLWIFQFSFYYDDDDDDDGQHKHVKDLNIFNKSRYKILGLYKLNFSRKLIVEPITLDCFGYKT